MASFDNRLSESTPIDLIRRATRQQRTGALAGANVPRAERIYFVRGAIYLPPRHVLAPALRRLVGGPEEPPADESGASAEVAEAVVDLSEEGLAVAQALAGRPKDAAPQEPEATAAKPVDEWVDVSSYLEEEEEAPEESAARTGELRKMAEQLVEVLRPWPKSSYRLVEGPEHLATGMVGPLPSSLVVMAAAIQNRSDFELLRQLGGENEIFDARLAAAEALEIVDLRPEEAFFLTRLETPLPVKELLRQTDLDRKAALTALCRLQAVDLIGAPVEHKPIQDDGVLTEELVERLLDRVAESLGRQPLAIAADAHRHQVGELMGRMGNLDHYQLLGMEVGSTSEDIHGAYLDLARRVHPQHAKSLGLRGGEAGLRLLFERATEAYLTLSDPDRTRRYHRRMGPMVGGSLAQVDAHARRKEEQELAAQNYRLAKGLVARQDYHFAVEVLRQVVQTDPRPEYLALLGRCLAMNPRWLDEALRTYDRALGLKPNDPSLHCDLGQVYELNEDLEKAKAKYMEAMDIMPAYPDAVAGLERLATSKKDGEKPDLMAMLKARFRKEEPGEG